MIAQGTKVVREALDEIMMPEGPFVDGTIRDRHIHPFDLKVQGSF